MRVLVTGSGGQLAREVIKVSNTEGYDTTALERQSLDITDFSAVSKTISELKPDVVINCAAYNNVDGAEDDWESAFLVNGIGVKNLALACNANGSVLVHFSTDYVFDGDNKKPYTIADRPNPVSRYGKSKLLGEELLKNHAERYFLIRTSWVFGLGKFSFPKKVIEWASKNENLRIVDDQIASPSYTVDLAEALMKLIKTGNYGLYHMTNSGYCSRYEWAAFILKKINWQGRLEPAKSAEFNTPARRPEFSVLDNFPLAQTIGRLLPSWQDATERFLNEVTG
jgi:dTDP-4-dehydrorhamnose reductase